MRFHILGGVSSFREAWRHSEIMADAKTRAVQLGWNGVGMFEYRWNPDTDQFYLMEFNARFWGSLHLALFAGVDFPKLLADAFYNNPNPVVTDYQLIRCRLTFPLEIEYIFSCLKDSELSWFRKIKIIAEFVYLGLNPTVYNDFDFSNDRAIYWRMIIRSIRKFLS